MAGLAFKHTMDPHALDVDRENPAKDGVIDGSTSKIGSIQWHPERQPRFVTLGLESFTLHELEIIIGKLRHEKTRRR